VTWDAAIEKSGRIEKKCFKQLQALGQSL